ncbi:aldehyde dehydrogenase family protein [Streptomyces sp. GQFP]|uniref:aldehyde dehydrogenase family protein n=1 Tax=Streptomyces sp. GQFP TaxID=2907545 RepID=UPI001F1A9C0E|nr:aldehyde dehydrogenase family protein [Streptomyces sp. GQFP]UIX29171.1 aldehyde dehydrogenase family protein [Streptomyces sp. GQFP]
MATVGYSTAQRITQPGVKAFLASPVKKLLINNRWVDARSGRTFEIVDPTTEDVLARAAEGDAADVDAAVDAARTAFEGPWGRLPVAERARYLLRFAAAIEANLDELAELESLNNGQTLATAKAMITEGAVGALHFYAGSAVSIHGETPATDESFFNYSLREPIGVCAGIIPWNVPIPMAVWKIAPALAAGNTVIIKPAEQTPLTAVRLGELLLETGIPDGVVNIVTGFGPGAGSAIAEHPGIDKVAFTGSTEVGRSILRASTGNLKRVTLELGGKSPNVVFADANMAAAVPTALAGFSLNSGQICAAGTRILVQRDAHDEFVETLTRYAGGLTLGDPLDPASDMGPLSSKEQFERVTGYLDVGKAEGARATTGGSPADGRGYFVEPTVFVDVDNDMRIAREEIFGPVVSVIPFTDENDAVLQGNDTSYGLAAAVWTNDLGRAHRVARRLKAGSVWVNNYYTNDLSLPFGGYKQSGVGREHGSNWYEHYTEVKSVYVKL